MGRRRRLRRRQRRPAGRRQPQRARRPGLVYDPAKETATTIIGVNPDPEAGADNYDGPDNITVSPYGGVILAEDGNGVQHLVRVTDQGKSYTLARNDVSGTEFTGPVFSPDGKTLFASIHPGPGCLFAITGPWGRPSNAV